MHFQNWIYYGKYLLNVILNNAVYHSFLEKSKLKFIEVVFYMLYVIRLCIFCLFQSYLPLQLSWTKSNVSLIWFALHWWLLQIRLSQHQVALWNLQHKIDNKIKLVKKIKMLFFKHIFFLLVLWIIMIMTEW